MECYSALKKKKELSSHEKTGRNLKCTLLSEKSQPGKVTHCMIPPPRHSGKGNALETVEGSVVVKGCGGGRGGGGALIQ